MTDRKTLFDYCKSAIAIIGLVAIITGCGTDPKKSKELTEAYETHLKSLSIRNEVINQLGQLIDGSDSTFLANQRGLFESIQLSIQNWDEQLVEVPGFEEEHDHSGHDHDHDHDHGNELELTPKQHLEVQKHLLQEIQNIGKQLDSIQALN